MNEEENGSSYRWPNNVCSYLVHQCLDTSKKWKDTDLKSQVLPQLKKDRPTRYFFKTATLNISIIIRDNPNSQV